MDEKDLKSIALIGSVNPPQNSNIFSLSFVSAGNGIRLSSKPVFIEFLQVCDFFYSDFSGSVLGVSNANLNLTFTPNTFVLNDALSYQLDAGVNVMSNIQYLILRAGTPLRFEIPVLRFVDPAQRLSDLAVNIRPSLPTGANDFFQCSIRLFWREL
jgi:hypothetical protein